MKRVVDSNYVIYDTPISISVKTVAKYLKYRLVRIIYSIIVRLLHPRYKEKKYKVSIAAIFRDEAPYLREWIEYHHIVGVEHFYLYNNFSTDNYKEILIPYIERGWVTLCDWPYKQAQMEAYADCIKECSEDTNWLGFIDLDEYVVPIDTDSIYDILYGYKNRPVVVFQWRFFGTSGIDKRNMGGLITEDFIKSWPKLSDIGKVFFNTGYDYCPESGQYMHVRWARYKGIKIHAVNLQDRVCAYGFNSISKNSLPAQINHYVLKSKEEYFTRKAKRGGGIHDKSMHDKEYYDYYESRSDSTDLAIQRFIPQLKSRLSVNSTGQL